MKWTRDILPRAAGMLLIFTLLCGVAYTGIATGLAQILFPGKANGSIITVNGVNYGSELLGQYYTDDAHLWGRVMQLDVTTYRDGQGNALLYSAPSNLSPASEEYAALVAQRVEKIRASNPAMDETAIPVDLVTGSASGLDPHISPAAAEYQVPRIAAASGRSEAEIRDVIAACTTGKLLGILGEETVNVLRVNLTLDGIMHA